MSLIDAAYFLSATILIAFLGRLLWQMRIRKRDLAQHKVTEALLESETNLTWRSGIPPTA
jgi:hypothetical protein